MQTRKNNFEAYFLKNNNDADTFMWVSHFAYHSRVILRVFKKNRILIRWKLKILTFLLTLLNKVGGKA